MSDPIVSYDQSTWLAARVADAAILGPPKLPSRIALPGAKVAISHDHLMAYHEAGLGEHQIRERVNAGRP